MDIYIYIIFFVTGQRNTNMYIIFQKEVYIYIYTYRYSVSPEVP